MSAANKGQGAGRTSICTEETKEKLRITNGALAKKNYVFRSPDGDTVRAHNISVFAIEYSLSRFNVSSIVRGYRKTHKGWSFVGFED
jgi:hypothetical protein